MSQLTDDGVANALSSAAQLVESSSERLAEANAADVEAAKDLDEGTRDRLRRCCLQEPLHE